ncbi:MAG: dihydroorotate dehydrogenase electron transfer subunit [Pirellulaceae bacterium]|nr:dihydroorotate dehydrogenase electron transfer subunit [Pirellulaceae bacterium]
MNPLHAKYYADEAVQVSAEIVENVRLAKDTYRLRFLAPDLARRFVPGQFLMLRLTGFNDPLIGRPLALYDTVLSTEGEPEAVDVVYLVKGKLTSRLWQMQPGQRIDAWGPLGNGFLASEPNGPVSTEHLVLVAGGIGYTPFLALAQEALGKKRYGDPPRKIAPARQVSFCYGARTADYFAGLEQFRALGLDLRLATDDGSLGHHGLVTDLVRQVLEEHARSGHHGRVRIVCCGPEPMMEAVAHIARERNVPCQVSLETPMACGIGICFTCVAKVRQPDGGWDYKRTCVDGPVFDAELIEW